MSACFANTDTFSHSRERETTDVLTGQKPIVYCTGKHIISDEPHYMRTRELRTLAKTY